MLGRAEALVLFCTAGLDVFWGLLKRKNPPIAITKRIGIIKISLFIVFSILVYSWVVKLHSAPSALNMSVRVTTLPFVHLCLSPRIKRAITPHIAAQPIKGRAATKLTAPRTGTKINRPTTTAIIKAITQGFKHLLHELKNLFIVKFYTFLTVMSLRPLRLSL